MTRYFPLANPTGGLHNNGFGNNYKIFDSLLGEFFSTEYEDLQEAKAISKQYNQKEESKGEEKEKPITHFTTVRNP